MKTVCPVRVLAFLLVALLISNAHTSFAQSQNETDQRSSATEDVLERTKTRSDPADNHTFLPRCGLETSSRLPTAMSSSGFRTTSKGTPPPPSITPVLGPQSTLFLLVNFLDDQIMPITREDMYAAAFTYERGIGNYYATTSYGKISITGDVTPWLTIPYNSNHTCDPGNWRLAANAAASATGYDLTSYTHFVYIWPANNPFTGVVTGNCGWEGFSSGSVSYINAWVNSSGFFYDASSGNPFSQVLIYLIAHEFGHGLGITNHAGMLLCDDGKRTIDSYSNCTGGSPTGDWDDVMSYANPAREMNAPHRAALGWFDPSQVQKVTTDGIYTISPLEIRDSNVKALKIQKSDTGESYYFSYRLPIGPFDNYLFNANGTSIHIWDGYTASATRGVYALPWTTTIFPGQQRPSALMDGMRFEDSINGIRVTQVSHDANGVILSIKFGGIGCESYSPLVSVFQPGGSSQANAGYLSKPYTLLVFNNNSVTCQDSSFYLSSAGMPAGWSTFYSGSTQAIQAQSYILLKDQVQTSPSSVVNDYSFVETATRTDAPAYTSSASGTVRITTADVTPPTAPTNLAARAENTSVSLSWTASTDNVGVVSYSITRNDITGGGSMSVDTTSPSYIDTATDPNHLYCYTVYARDGVGLQSRTAMVKVSANLPVIDIITPGDGSRVSGIVSVAVDASANWGVTKVELYVDNKLTSTSTAAPFATNWNTRKVASGQHSLQCKAYDTRGHVGTSAMVRVAK